MPTYPRSAVTAKQGINFVRTVVEEAGSLFHKIEQENDLGIDALIELLRHGKPLNHQIAVQIKSGQTYYSSQPGECVFPIADHREYWARHRLPVYRVVYVPTLKTAFWIDIKHYLKRHPDATTVHFRTSEANRFDSSSFARLFIPSIVKETPSLSLEEAFHLARSPKVDELYLAVVVLFRRHPNVPRVWDEFVRCLRERPVEEIPGHLVYYLAHIPGHGDIYYFGEQITPATREYARSLLANLGYSEIVKLLSLIDPENSISRGSIGQSVHAVLSSLPQAPGLLRQVAAATELSLFVRECAALILAIEEGTDAAPVLQEVAASGSWYANELLAHLLEYGHINPY
ncbi:MAG: DUF4365 domain-containing protein [Betaproteobacteria bacterium]|nr:DUF4365 domain-containing protein [Betaproteobacteria bacterium]